MADYTESQANNKELNDVTSEDFTSTGDKLKLIGKDNIQNQVAGERPGSEVAPLQMGETHKDDSKLSSKKTSEGLKVIIASSITFALAVTVALIVTIYFAPPQVTPHGAVVSRNSLCSDIGVDILQKEGSAVDAAIATTLCMSVVEPSTTGIGGGGMMIVRNHKQKTTTVIDAHETAPMKAEKNMFKNKPQDSKLGAKSVAVPGLLKGLEMAHQKYGKLPWKKVIKPAAELARNGFNVSKYLADCIEEHLTDAVNDNMTNTFRQLKEGDWLKLPALAETLDAIAEEGAKVFYEGYIAEEIQQLMAENGAIMNMKDLKNYSAVARDPVSIIFQNKTIETVPAPGGGPSVLLILNILQNYSLSAQNLTAAHVNLTYHRFLEALKFASAESVKLGDPDFSSNVENATKHMISSKFAASLIKRIDDNNTHPADYYSSQGKRNLDHGTSHVSVVGPSEDFVAITSSLNDHFGSQLMTPSGIILNNRMNSFDTEGTGDQLNYIEGGKRPRTSISPTIVYTVKKACGSRFAIGGSNGTRIVPGVAEVLLNLFGFGMNVSEAISSPRIYTSYDEDVLEYDNDFDQTVLSSLDNKGHSDPSKDLSGVSNVNAVMKINETISGYSDPRSEGKASVY